MNPYALIAFLILISGVVNAVQISTPGAKAARLIQNKRILLAYGTKDVDIYDAATGNRQGTISGTSKVLSIGENGGAIWGLGSEEAKSWTLYKLSIEKGEVIERFSVPKTGYFLIDFIVLDKKSALLIQTARGVSPRAQVISLEEKKNKNDLGSITTGIYGHLGYQIEGQTIYLPGGYPGVIVSIDFSDPNDVKIAQRYPVEDWLHDIKKVAGQEFIAAGSQSGVNLYSLPDKAEGRVEGTPLLDTLNANILVENDKVYACSPEKLEIVDLKTKKVVATNIEPIQSHSRYLLPLGRNKEGKLVLFEGGAGLHITD